MIRLLPYRQVDDQFVINMFSTVAANDMPTDTDADAGMVVKVSANDLDQPTIQLANNSLLGKTDYPYVARNQYPSVPMKVEACGASDVPLGITLAQTLIKDENGENLLRYPQKQAEMYSVNSGQSVPIVTKGILTFDETAFTNDSADLQDADTYADYKVAVAAADGKMTLKAAAAGSDVVIGKVLGVGVRTSKTNTDQFAGAFGESAAYVIVKVDL